MPWLVDSSGDVGFEMLAHLNYIDPPFKEEGTKRRKGVCEVCVFGEGMW